MVQYDSDSSFDDDAASGVATNVLLGYATTEATEDEVSHLGGEPSWLDSAKPPSASLARCKSCNTHMPILLQLNGALPDRFPGHERRLYIWGCPKRRCRRKEGSMRAVRGVRVDQLRAKAVQVPAKAKGDYMSMEQPQPERNKPDIGSQLFGASSNPFSSSSSSSAASTANPFSTTAKTVSSSSPLANPFSTPATSTTSQQETTSTLSQTFAEKARISAPQEPSQSNMQTNAPEEKATEEETIPWPTADLPTPYPHYYLDADYEYLSPTSNETNGASSKHYDALMDVDSNAAGSSSGGGAGDKDLYESAHDKTFQHFADTLSQNPEQVLRYEFGGSPLLYSRSDAVGRLLSSPSTASQPGSSASKISTVTAGSTADSGPSNGADVSPRFPRCRHCGSARAFEVQLTPHAIAELEADEEPAKMLTEGMEWGAVIVAVCVSDCVPDSDVEKDTVVYREEWCGVQWEETVARDSGSGSKGKKN